MREAEEEREGSYSSDRLVCLQHAQAFISLTMSTHPCTLHRGKSRVSRDLYCSYHLIPKHKVKTSLSPKPWPWWGEEGKMAAVEREDPRLTSSYEYN